MKRLLLLSMALCVLMSFAHAQSYQTRQARTLIEQEKYAEAARMLRPLADSGDAEAQYLAAGLFFNGNGVIKSETQGMKYLVMAAEQYHIGATFQYVMKSVKTTEPEKLVAVIDDCLKNNPDASKSQLVYCLYLLSDDKERGWTLIANSATDKDGDCMMSRKDVISLLEKEHEAFYKFLIDKYINSPQTLKDKLLDEYLRSASRDLGFQWAHESMEYILEKIKTCDPLTQKEHYGVWRKGMFRLFKTICAVMNYEGIGVKRNLSAARTTALDIKSIGNADFPWIKEMTEKILDTYEPGLVVANNITVKDVYGDTVLVNNGSGDMAVLASDLTDTILDMKRQAIELEEKKNNVRALSTRQRIIVDPKPRITYRYGDLEIMFVVKTDSPNNVRFGVTGAGCTNETRYDDVTYDVIGLVRRGSLLVIPPNKSIYVKVKIEGVPRTGSFNQVAVAFSSDYGNGHLLINDLVW